MIPDFDGVVTYGDNYYPFNILKDLDSAGYAAKVREAYDGGVSTDAPLLKEEKVFSIGGGFMPFFYAIPMKSLWFMEFKDAFLLTKFMFVVLSIIVLYFFFYYIFEDKLFSGFSTVAIATKMFVTKEMVTAILIVVGKIIPPLSNAILIILGKDSSNLVVINSLFFGQSRLTPIPAFIYFALSIWAYLALFNNDKLKSWKYPLFGSLWAFALYSYIYYGVLFYIIVGVTVLGLLLKKKYDVARQFMITGFISLLFMIPYILFLPKTSIDFMTRNYIETGHFLRVFFPEFFLYGIWFIFLFFISRYINKGWRWFLGASFISVVIASNLQIITGVNPQPVHWVQVGLFFVQFFILTILYLLYKGFGEPKKALIGVTVILLILGFGWNYQYQVFSQGKMDLDQDQRDLYDYLDSPQFKNKVIMTDSILLNYHIPIYTPANIFYPQGFGTQVSNDEIWDRAMLTYYYTFHMPEEFEKIIDCKSRGFYDRRQGTEVYLDPLVYMFQINYYQPVPKSFIVNRIMENNLYIKEKDCDIIYEEYKDMWRNEPDNPYEVDYIITEMFLQRDGIKEIKRIGKYNIYEVLE